MGCGTSFVKYVLFFFNLLFALAGLAMVGLGVAVLLNWGMIKDILKDNLTVAPWVFIVIGAIVFIIAFFGCCGAIRESHCMVVTYSIFLLVIIIVQVALAVLMFVYAENIKTGMSNTISSWYASSTHDAAARTTFNNLETQLQCCGNNGPTDYGLTVPNSCCPRRGQIGNIIDACTILDASKVGCNQRAIDIYETWNKVIAGVAIGVACVEVVGALFALCLANSIRNMDRRY